jgi:hypothetical protein
MSDYTKQTLTSADAIATDQAPAGIQGRLIRQDESGQLQVWSKPLQAPNTRAVALFNRTRNRSTISVTWRELGLPGRQASVKDVWAGTSPQLAADGYSATVPGHSITLLLVTGAPCPSPAKRC